MVQVISESRPVARKPHQCLLCLRTIEPGERYLRQFNADEYSGDRWTWRQCAHCEAAVLILDPYTDDGLDRDAMREHEARDLAEARVFVMWRRGWRRRDGTLRPVPGSES